MPSPTQRGPGTTVQRRAPMQVPRSATWAGRRPTCAATVSPRSPGCCTGPSGPGPTNGSSIAYARDVPPPDERVAAYLRAYQPGEGLALRPDLQTRPPDHRLPEDQLTEWSREHMARWDPRRVANDRGVKRALVQQAMGWLATPFRTSADRTGRLDAAILADPILRSLARSYSDHPDFQEEWRYWALSTPRLCRRPASTVESCLSGPGWAPRALGRPSPVSVLAVPDRPTQGRHRADADQPRSGRCTGSE